MSNKSFKRKSLQDFRPFVSPKKICYLAYPFWFKAGFRLTRQYKDQQAIAFKFGISEPIVFASWLRSLNYIRNICAHHSRLWNRNVVDQPKLSKAGEVLDLDYFRGKQDLIARPFLIFCIMQYLLNRICPNSHWNERFKQLVNEFPEIGAGGICAENMGLIEDWESWAMWQ